MAMMDYGVKQHMIECLRRRGCKVTVLPAFTPAQEVLSGGFDGVMLSNGPGDPAENTAIIADKERQRPPLSEQKEFRAIKNAVIQEVEHVRLNHISFEDRDMGDNGARVDVR